MSEETDEAKLRIVNRQINPLLADLPEKFRQFEPHQIKAISQVVDAMERVDLVFLDAPTGSGKTVIGEASRRMMKAAAIYICSTKSLQDQFVNDFPYANVLKGRRNYPTESFPSKFHPGEFAGHLSAEDCTWTKKTGTCKWCTSKGKCPYEIAKGRALGGALAVLNTSYFLSEVNNIGRFAGWPLVIADEADTLEGNLMSYVSVEITEKRMEKYGLSPPKKVTVASSWAEWLDEVMPVIKKEYDAIPEFVEDIRTIREAKYLAGLYEKLGFVKAGLDDGYWVYTGKEGFGASFQPSRVDSLGQEYLWAHGEKWLLMSASLVSPEEVAESLGYQGSYEVVSVPSTFPIENRRVVFAPAADMAMKHKETAWPHVAEKLITILCAHPTDSVLVHTVSYALGSYLATILSSSAELRGENRQEWRLLDLDRQYDEQWVRSVQSQWKDYFASSTDVRDGEGTDTGRDGDRSPVSQQALRQSNSFGSDNTPRELSTNNSGRLPEGPRVYGGELLLPGSRENLSKMPPRTILAYKSASTKNLALEIFSQTPGSILLAPSMDRGIDLAGDLCRVQVIVKCPFPFLDRVTSARLHSRGGQTWYTVQTVRSIVQMCGRAVRNKSDHAVTYILDKQFESGVWSRGRGLFPSWFSEAIDWRSGRER